MMDKRSQAALARLMKQFIAAPFGSAKYFAILKKMNALKGQKR